MWHRSLLSFTSRAIKILQDSNKNQTMQAILVSGSILVIWVVPVLFAVIIIVTDTLYIYMGEACSLSDENMMRNTIILMKWMNEIHE